MQSSASPQGPKGALAEGKLTSPPPLAVATSGPIAPQRVRMKSAVAPTTAQQQVGPAVVLIPSATPTASSSAAYSQHSATTLIATQLSSQGPSSSGALSSAVSSQQQQQQKKTFVVPTPPNVTPSAAQSKQQQQQFTPPPVRIGSRGHLAATNSTSSSSLLLRTAGVGAKVGSTSASTPSPMLAAAAAIRARKAAEASHKARVLYGIHGDKLIDTVLATKQAAAQQLQVGGSKGSGARTSAGVPNSVGTARSVAQRLLPATTVKVEGVPPQQQRPLQPPTVRGANTTATPASSSAANRSLSNPTANAWASKLTCLLSSVKTLLHHQNSGSAKNTPANAAAATASSSASQQSLSTMASPHGANAATSATTATASTFVPIAQRQNIDFGAKVATKLLGDANVAPTTTDQQQQHAPNTTATSRLNNSPPSRNSGGGIFNGPSTTTKSNVDFGGSTTTTIEVTPGLMSVSGAPPLGEDAVTNPNYATDAPCSASMSTLVTPAPTPRPATPAAAVAAAIVPLQRAINPLVANWVTAVSMAHLQQHQQMLLQQQQAAAAKLHHPLWDEAPQSTSTAASNTALILDANTTIIAELTKDAVAARRERQRVMMREVIAAAEGKRGALVPLGGGSNSPKHSSGVNTVATATSTAAVASPPRLGAHHSATASATQSLHASPSGSAPVLLTASSSPRQQRLAAASANATNKVSAEAIKTIFAQMSAIGAPIDVMTFDVNEKMRADRQALEERMAAANARRNKMRMSGGSGIVGGAADGNNSCSMASSCGTDASSAAAAGGRKSGGAKKGSRGAKGKQQQDSAVGEKRPRARIAISKFDADGLPTRLRFGADAEDAIEEDDTFYYVDEDDYNEEMFLMNGTASASSVLVETTDQAMNRLLGLDNPNDVGATGDAFNLYRIADTCRANNAKGRRGAGGSAAKKAARVEVASHITGTPSTNAAPPHTAKLAITSVLREVIACDRITQMRRHATESYLLQEEAVLQRSSNNNGTAAMAMPGSQFPTSMTSAADTNTSNDFGLDALYSKQQTTAHPSSFLVSAATVLMADDDDAAATFTNSLAAYAASTSSTGGLGMADDEDDDAFNSTMVGTFGSSAGRSQLTFTGHHSHSTNHFSNASASFALSQSAKDRVAADELLLTQSLRSRVKDAITRARNGGTNGNNTSRPPSPTPNTATSNPADNNDQQQQQSLEDTTALSAPYDVSSSLHEAMFSITSGDLFAMGDEGY